MNTEKSEKLKRKKKGGAELQREKKKNRLAEEAKKCQNLTSMFLKEKQGASSSNSPLGEAQNFEPTSESTPAPLQNLETQNETNLETEAPNQSSNEVDEQLMVSEPDQDIITDPSEPTPTLQAELQNDPSQEEEQIFFFKRPVEHEINNFFHYHPKVPISHKKFNCQIAFKTKNNTPRQWLTYSSLKDALFCTVCLAFSKTTDTSVFIDGMSNWKHVYQRIDEHHNSLMHESSSSAYFRFCSDASINKLLFKNQMTLRQKNISHNRQILDRVINVIKMIGKRGLSYRGTSSEACYTLENKNIDHGNFLEVILLLSQYDVVLKKHLDKIIPESKKMHEKGTKRRSGDFTSFLSKTTINYVIDIISKKMKKIITGEICEAEIYSIELDTTQDVSTIDQLALVIRYVLQGVVYERLLSFVCCRDSTGAGIHNLIIHELESNNLKKESCIGDSTDGAANMQGIYKGFVANMKKENNEHVHVWCYSHILNLIIGDLMKVSIKASSVFNLINKIAVFFRESHIRMDIWNKINIDDNKKRKLQTIAETRWWAKETALSKIFGTYGCTISSMYVEVLLALKTIENSHTMNSDVRATAKSLRESLQKYEVILIAHIFLKIFSITGPLSRYLQTKGLDLLKANNMAQTALKQLRQIQRDFKNIQETSDMFVKWVIVKLEAIDSDLDGVGDIEIETYLPEVRVRRVKKMPGEDCKDEKLNNANDRFRIETYNLVLDTIIQSMDERFTTNFNICKDFNILDPRNFDNLKGRVPSNSLETLSEKLIKINPLATSQKLQDELENFMENWDTLKLNINEFYNSNFQRESSDEEDNNQEDRVQMQCKSCRNCTLCCYSIIFKYNMYKEAYPMLALAYKYLLTLPISQVACERSFSKLKYLKNRLRSTLSQSRLDAFMLMSCENDILNKIENDEVIDALGRSSTLFSKKLFY